MRLDRLLVLRAAVVALRPATAAAEAPQPVTMEAVKGVHSATGTWSATGALASSGTFVTERFSETAYGAPDFVVTHVTYLFSSRSGAYATLQGTGTVSGTVDHHSFIVSRIYVANVQS